MKFLEYRDAIANMNNYIILMKMVIGYYILIMLTVTLVA